jgi:DNA-directed RNA polymerase alpha subunit
LKVNYFIENLQPIQNSFGKEIVHIELWTNGSIHPRKALNIAISFLKNMFDKFEDMEKVNSRMAKSFFESDTTFVEILKTFEYNLNFSSAIESKTSTFLQENKESGNISSFLSNQFEEKEKNFDNSTFSVFHKFSLNSSIYVLNLPYRVSQCLIQNNLLTIEDLVKFRAKELGKLSGIGNFSLSLIQKKFKKIGFELKS